MYIIKRLTRYETQFAIVWNPLKYVLNTMHRRWSEFRRVALFFYYSKQLQGSLNSQNNNHVIYPAPSCPLANCRSDLNHYTLFPILVHPSPIALSQATRSKQIVFSWNSFRIVDPWVSFYPTSVGYLVIGPALCVDAGVRNAPQSIVPDW